MIAISPHALHDKRKRARALKAEAVGEDISISRRPLPQLLEALGAIAKVPVWARYILATLIVTINFGIRWFLHDLYPYPYLLFIPSVIIVSLLFNARTGFYASVLGAVYAFSFFVRGEVIWLNIVSAMVFTLIGFFTAYVIETLRNMMRELEQKNREVIAAQHKLYQAQKLEVVGQAMAILAHDFRNALTPISGSIDLLARSVPPSEENKNLLQMLEKSVAGGKRLVDDILVFSRREEKLFGFHELVPLLNRYFPLIRQMARDKIRFECRFADGLPAVCIDPELFYRALANLIANAQDAMPDGGKITLEAYLASLPQADAKTVDLGIKGDYVCLAVSDTGTGIPEDKLDKVFQPFFTTKPSGQGTGLGLAMIADFMHQAGGLATVTSAVGQGTTVRLYFALQKKAV